MIFLVNGSTDAPYNLALEELLASNFEEEIFMLWRNRNAVIVGRNQNTAAEVNADFVRANNIQVVRRMTGGGAVYHDLAPSASSAQWGCFVYCCYTAMPTYRTPMRRSSPYPSATPPTPLRTR